MSNSVKFGSLRPLLDSLPATMSQPEKQHQILVFLRSQMHGLPRPLARRMALLTKKLGMATEQTPKAYLDKLNRELKQLDKEIRQLPQFQSLFGA